MQGGDGGYWRELEAESVTVGIGCDDGFGDCQGWDVDTRRPPWSGERVEAFVVDDAANLRRNNVLRVGLVVSEVCNDIEHPVSESEGPHRWSSDFRIILFCLIENRLEFPFFLGNLLIDITFWESCALRGGHFAEVASLHTLQVIPVASLDVDPFLHHDHEVFGADLAKVVSNNDGSLILAPLLDCLEDQDSGSGIESGSRLICDRS